MKSISNKYISDICHTFKKGDATEPSYYKHLEDFIKEFSISQRKKKIDVTQLPKRTEAGNPDFRIWDGVQKIIGYIEAKDLDAKLDSIEDTEQLRRYLTTFPNVILTNYTEFRLYRDGLLIEKVSIARPFVIKKLSTIPPIENEDQLFKLLDRFLSYSLPRTFTAKSLAVELAKRTKFLKDEIVIEELKSGTKAIHGFYEAFKEFLIAGINEEEFADLYSQTITYGLFAARLRAPKDFNRELAYSYIPKSIGILRDIFQFISLGDPPKQMEVMIDDIAEVLAVSDAKKILNQFYHEGKGSDPVLHFYETFLSVYDPATREKRGVYYTPEPVVSFIVRSLHLILKEKFDFSDGIASKNVTLLDPAGGTLSFLAKAIEIAVEEFESKYGKGGVKSFLRDQILQNYYSFELMMAPYAIGHMKMSFLLEELGYRMEDEERVKYYLTNTLEMRELEETKFPGMSSLSHESHIAGKVKKNVPILVILGNPPYSGISSNSSDFMSKIPKGDIYVTGYEIQETNENGYKQFKAIPKTKKTTKPINVKQKTWIGEQIENYKIVDGDWFGEKKHWLNNDYVKFIRFSQWKIDQAGEGVLGFITDNSYLDNITFRGMRQSLLNSFDEMYILDLHGNSNKKEKNTDGSKDENVFDIQQGVSIIFFIKNKKGTNTSIYHQELLGIREEKYEWLNKHNINNVKWAKLSPQNPYYFFIPRDEKHSGNYQKYVSIQDIFQQNVCGIVTARDNLAIDFDKSSLVRKLEIFRNEAYDAEYLKKALKITENYQWKIEDQRNKFLKDKNWKHYFTKILYRPFDIRNIYYQENIVFRTRREVMRNMLSENIGIICPRQFKEKSGAFVTTQICGHKTVSAYDINYLFPLYIYPTTDNKDLFSDHESADKKSNINPILSEEINKKYNEEIVPEDIFYYVYAILYCNIYRTKYLEFLKIDYPRIPFAKEYNLFLQLSKLGKNLVNLHLLISKDLDLTICKFPESGSNITEKVNYDGEKVWINKDQYFDGIKEVVWLYQIGGYQVCDKWLKDRKGRTLSSEDIKTYCKIVTALSKTIELQIEIDNYYKNVETTI